MKGQGCSRFFNMLSFLSLLVLHTFWNTGTYFFATKNIKEGTKETAQCWRALPKMHTTTCNHVLGHLMPFSSLHIQVEHVHMCTHGQNENKHFKKENCFLLCLLLIFPFLHYHCAFFWPLKCWTHLQKWEKWCSDIFSTTFLSNSRAGVKSDCLSDVYTPR